MSRLNIKEKEDRLTVAKILAGNDYTVRLSKQRRAGKKSFDYFVEYEPNTCQPDEKEAVGE